MKQLGVLILIFILCSPSNAQETISRASIGNIKEIPLVVVLRSFENKAQSFKNKLKTKIEINDQFNSEVKALMDTFWNLTSEVEFITVEQDDDYELPEMNKFVASGTDYLILRLRIRFDFNLYFVIEHPSAEKFYAVHGLFAKPRALDLVHVVRDLQIQLADNVSKKAPPAKMSTGVIRSLDATKRNNDQLKNKTLLLLNTAIDKKLTRSLIKEVYEFPFEITDYDNIREKVFNKTPGYAYVYPQKEGSQIIYDTESGRVLGYVRYATAVIPVGKKGLDRLKITKKSLKGYIK